MIQPQPPERSQDDLNPAGAGRDEPSPVEPSSAEPSPAEPSQSERNQNDQAGPDPALPGLTPPTRAGRLSIVLLILALAFVAVALVRNWDAVRDDLAALSWVDLAASGLAAAGAVLLTGLSWYALLVGLGARMGLHPALTVYAAGQLGKYVPGSVWVVAIQAELGRRQGVARSVMALSYLLAVLVAIGTGGLVGLLTLLVAGDGSTRVLGPVLGVIGVLSVAVLARPQPINAALHWLAARTGRQVPDVALTGRALVGALLPMVAAWGLFGLHAWLLARPMGAGADLLAPTTGAFALAFVAGLLLVPLPAGAGVREGVLVAILGGTIGASAALTVGLASRLVLVVVDLLLAVLLGVPRMRRALPGRSARSDAA